MAGGDQLERPGGRVAAVTWEVLLGRAAPDIPGHVQVQAPRSSPQAVQLVQGLVGQL